MKLTEQVKHHIQNQKLYRSGDLIIIGVSGGPDSAALTHILHTLRYELGLTLHIAHFNHNLQKNAKEDQSFVKKLADQINIPCSTALWTQSKTQTKGSIEESARAARFQFLIKQAKRFKAQHIALAHTQNDLAETVLMRIIRGSGLQGLQAILPQRYIDGVSFTRPLLDVQKNDLLRYLNKNKIDFREDPTNRQTKFFRNKIRLELMPLLAKEYNPNIESVLANVSNNLALDFVYLDEQADHFFNKLAIVSKNTKNIRLDLNKFLKLHPAMRRMLLRRSFMKLKGTTNKLTLTHIKKIETLINDPVKSVGPLNLPKNINIKKSVQFITISSTVT